MMRMTFMPFEAEAHFSAMHAFGKAAMKCRDLRNDPLMQSFFISGKLGPKSYILCLFGAFKVTEARSF